MSIIKNNKKNDYSNSQGELNLLKFFTYDTLIIIITTAIIFFNILL